MVNAEHLDSDSGHRRVRLHRARQKEFFELHAHHQSQISAQALHYIAQLYEIEREIKLLRSDDRHRIRRASSKPLADALHQ